MPNPITVENLKTAGVTDRSYWDASHSNQIEGFTTDISVNAGQSVNFKINVNGNASDTLPYKLEIFRLGYYGGFGAREVWESVNPDGTVQPAAMFDESRGLVDAGNWAITDSWTIPTDAVSGIYLARVQRLDTSGDPIEGATNQIPFIVRNDGVAADIVLQTSDTTWQAYNGWAGNNGVIGPNFYGDPADMVDHEPVADPGLGAQDRAYAVSYNRPFLTRDGGGAAAGAQDYLFGADYAAVFWLEKNGYDVSYIAGVDTDRLGAAYLQNYNAFISVGHDEYWSGGQRDNVEAARDAGVNLLFWSGNEVYWKTRWDESIADGTDWRTLVCYKETWANGDPNATAADYANIDPSTEWTGTWRDMRFVDSDQANGQEPENSLTGQLFGPDGTGEFGGALDVAEEYAGLRYWKNTVVEVGGEQNMAAGLIGYEWNVVPQDAYRPEGLITLSSTTIDWSGILIDQGNRVAPGTATHSLSLYRAESGALVFGSGTVFWSWGLSDEHDSSPYGATIENLALQQFTTNLFADMGIQPQSLQNNLVPGTASTDVTPGTTAINNVPDEVPALSSVTITGTATDVDGVAATTDGVVALVELSFDGGANWRAASGTTNWTFAWRPATAGTYTILARAIDDSLNVFNATPNSQMVTVTAAVPPNSASLFELNESAARSPVTDDAVEVGMRFRVSEPGDVTQLRYYRSTNDSDDTDVRDGHLWRVSDGALLGTVTFTSQLGESGWQIANLVLPVTLQVGVDYVVSYHTTGNYVASGGFFSPTNEEAFDGLNDDAFTDPFGMISAPQDGSGGANGVYRYGDSGGALPTTTFGSSNYWVDITFSPADAGPNEAPVFSSGNFTMAENLTSAGTVIASDSNGDAVQYSISGGVDAALFNINVSSGALTFITPPDFEAPADAGQNNVYDLIVSVSDSVASTNQASTVTVTDVAEGGTPTGSTLFVDVPTTFTDDPTSYELGTRFLPSQDGSIVALRYYRGTDDAADTDVRTLTLWNFSGAPLGSVVVTSAPGATGWQVGVLADPIAILADVNYVVSYSYNFGADDRYAATANYFTTSRPGSDGILTAPISGGPAGGNGVFAAGSPGTFPTGSYNASNYWVDVIFQSAGTGGDNEPPVFTSAASFNSVENQTAVGIVTATDPDSDALTFSITGGADASLFTIDALTGRFEFKNPQDFEGSGDPFQVIVSVFDGTETVPQTITVNLTDIDETADGPAAFTGHSIRAQYIFGTTPTSEFSGAGANQVATAGAGVEFVNLPSAGSDVGNGAYGLASVDVRDQTVRIEFPLDPAVFTAPYVKFAGSAENKPFNGVLLSDAGSLSAIRSVRIIGQEGFTTSTGQPLALTASDLTVTADGIFLNVANYGRVVDIDPDTLGAQAAWIEVLVELNDAPALADPLINQQADEGAAFNYTVPVGAFTDIEGDALTYSATLSGGALLPTWLTFDPATRTFSGTPSNADVGAISVTVNANDGYVATSDTFDITTTGVAAIHGTSGNDIVTGAAGDDLFMLHQGGDDTASGGDGNDGFYFGAALTSNDAVNGGAGTDDQVGMQGNYGALVLNAANFLEIETLVPMSGTDADFGDNAGNLYSYNITTAGSFGRDILINAQDLRLGENLTFNGSAEIGGTFMFYCGRGVDDLTGGSGNDGFFFGNDRYGDGDRVDGGPGNDNQLGLRGDYTIDFREAGRAGSVVNIQTIVLLSASDNYWGPAGDTDFDYSLILADHMVAAGQQLTVTGNGLTALESMHVDGTAVTSGTLRLIGALSADTLIGGSGADLIFGGGSADILRGNDGVDNFVYLDIAESTPEAYDRIIDFTPNVDRLNLEAIDSNASAGGNQDFSFIGTNGFSGSAGELRTFQSDSTNNYWQVESDVNGDGVADFLVQLTLTPGQSMTAGDILL